METGQIIFIIIIAIIWLVYYSMREYNKKMSTPEGRLELEQLKERQNEAHKANVQGAKNTAMICPHCQTKGSIRTKPTKLKKGISGGKATAAILTGGVSMLATGLSRKVSGTQAHCENCNATWIF